MEIIVFVILSTIFLIGVLHFCIENRKKISFIISILIYFWLVSMGVASHYKIHPIMLLLGAVFIILLFVIPAIFDYIKTNREKIKVSSKDFVLNYNLECSYDAPEYIEDMFEDDGYFAPLNSFSCFYDKNFSDLLYDRKALFISDNYSCVITCVINELKFYLIDRNCTYKIPRRKHHDFGPDSYTTEDFLCIVECEKPVNIPDFILRDRIPIIDTMRYCLDFFDKKYINFNFDRDFSRKYVVEGSDSKIIRDYFNLKIRNAFKNNQLKNVTMLCTNNLLLIKFPYSTSMEEKRSLFYIACALFKKDNELFSNPKQIKVLKRGDDDENGSILEYFRDNEGNISIPPFLGGLIILIMSIVVMALLNRFF